MLLFPRTVVNDYPGAPQVRCQGADTPMCRSSSSGVNTFGERSRRRTPVMAAKPSLANAARNASTVGGETFSSSAIAELAAIGSLVSGNRKQA